jgi:hypothetical protein
VSMNTAADVAARLRKIAAAAESDAPRAAVQAFSRAGETMVKLKLTTYTHEAGTPTPSPAGGVPALVSGKLRRGVQRSPAVPRGPASWSQVLGCVVSYGSVHEFGPVTVTAKNFPQLGNPTAGFFGKEVKIPRRPWMKPSVEALIASRLGTRAACTAFLGVIDRI